MAVELLPLAVLDAETGSYHRIGLTLLPEYHAREAARFVAMSWTEFVALSPEALMGAVAHYIANRLFTAHEADAVRLRQESEAKRGVKPRGA